MIPCSCRVLFRVLPVLACIWPGGIPAQPIQPERLDVGIGAPPVLLEDRIAGDAIVDYVIGAERGQILSVDMMTSNAAAYFNVLPPASDTALFVGSTSGHVADVPLPESGDYTIRVYLMRSAARRNETTGYSLAVGIGAPDFADSLAGGPDFWAVSGIRSALNVRSGPSTRYAVTSRLSNGEVLQNRGCRMGGGERWCSIRASGSGVTGWVAGRYLREAPPPRRPEMPPGGPVGNGTPFDATGSVMCAVESGQPMRSCLFGVIRMGPGNAGVWIAIGDGSERHVLFESGVPVTANAAAALAYEKVEDLYRISVGDELYEIPEAVVYGG